MLYNIAEPDQVYDNLLNPFKSNEISYFYQMNLSFFVFRVVLFFILIQILIEHPVSKQ